MIKHLKRSSLSLIFELYKNIPPRKRLFIYFLLILMILNAIAEIFTLSFIIPFLGIILEPDSILKYPLVRLIMESFSINSENISVFILGIFLFIIIISGLIRILYLYLTFKISANIGTFFSNKSYKNLISQSYEFHLLNNTSESLSSMTYHLDETITVINSVLIFLINFIVAFSIICTLFVVNSYITFLSSFVVVSFYFLISMITSKTIRDASLFIESAINKQYSIINESLYSIKEILLSKKEFYFLSSFKQIEGVKRNRISNVLFLSNFPKISLEILIFIIFAFVGYSFLGVSKENFEIISLLSVFAFGIQKLLPNIQGCYSSLSQIRARTASIINVLKILKIKDKIQNTFITDSSSFIFQNLTFKGVSYKYKQNHKYTIIDVNLSIEKGEKIGIIGPSGSGKSTFIDILMGLLPPSKGTYEINGTNIFDFKNRDFLDSWRYQVGHVPQDIYMINNSVAENIAFGFEKEFINYKKLKQAAKLAGIDNYIEQQKMQYETCFGENGVKLSGGQKQRVAIARALYKEPQILVLDEATSSLDGDTEKYILQSIKSLPKYITVVLISHRKSNLEICDNIYKFNKNGQLSLIS